MDHPILSVAEISDQCFKYKLQVECVICIIPLDAFSTVLMLPCSDVHVECLMTDFFPHDTIHKAQTIPPRLIRFVRQSANADFVSKLPDVRSSYSHRQQLNHVSKFRLAKFIVRRGTYECDVQQVQVA